MTTRVIQRTPNIGMALKLRRPSAGAPCLCEITGAGWGSLYPREIMWPVWGQEAREEYNQTPVILTNQWGETYLELPDRKTAYQIGLISEIPGIWWGYEPPPGFLLGIPFGDDLSGLKWSWSTTILNQYEDYTEGGWKGLEISQDGLYLSVYVWPGGLQVSGGGGYDGGYIPVIRLDATATCSDGTSASIWAEFGIQNSGY